MAGDVFYVGPVGPGRRLTGLYFATPHEAWISSGGSEEEWKKATDAGFAFNGRTWEYVGDEACAFSGEPTSGYKVAGVTYAMRDDMMAAMTACNEKAAGGSSGGCGCGGKKKGKGSKALPDTITDSNRGIEPGTGMGGPSTGGASMVTMAPLGPWAAAEAPGPGGDTVATGEGDEEDCCCCCCPCDPGGPTNSRGNTITSSPVEASRATQGLVISGPSSQHGSEGHGSRAQSQITSVPGYEGPLKTLGQASSAGGHGCGCGGSAQPSSSPAALPGIPSALAFTPQGAIYTDVFDVAPAAARTVLDRTILAGPTNGEQFANFSRDLLADVLTVSGTNSARVLSPVSSLTANTVNMAAPSGLRRTISG